MPNPLKCCNCGKKITVDTEIIEGFVKIQCKCGTINEIRAESKPVNQQVPYGERMRYEVKDGQMPIRVNTSENSRIGYKPQPPFGFNCAGDMIDANGVRLK